MTRYHFSKAYSQYGASLGRPSHIQGYNGEKLHLERVKLDSGGYDKGGAYWGTGEPLFVAWDDSGEFQLFVRAVPEGTPWGYPNSAVYRERAKRAVRKLLPDARFYR